MFMSQKLICRYVIHIKIPAALFVCVCAEIGETILKCIWKFKGLKIAKIILQKRKVEGHTLPIFKLTTKLTVQ